MTLETARLHERIAQAERDLVEIDGNAQFRRVWWLDDYIPSDAWESLIGQGPQ